jgi:hypothetical protein
MKLTNVQNAHILAQAELLYQVYLNNKQVRNRSPFSGELPTARVNSPVVQIETQELKGHLEAYLKMAGIHPEAIPVILNAFRDSLHVTSPYITRFSPSEISPDDINRETSIAAFTTALTHEIEKQLHSFITTEEMTEIEMENIHKQVFGFC